MHNLSPASHRNMQGISGRSGHFGQVRVFLAGMAFRAGRDSSGREGHFGQGGAFWSGHVMHGRAGHFGHFFF